MGLSYLKQSPDQAISLFTCLQLFQVPTTWNSNLLRFKSEPFSCDLNLFFQPQCLLLPSTCPYSLLLFPTLIFLSLCFICAIPTFLSNDVHILKPNLWIGNRSYPTRKYRSFCELLLKLCSLGRLVLAIYMSCLPLTSLRAETICN